MAEPTLTKHQRKALQQRERLERILRENPDIGPRDLARVSGASYGSAFNARRRFLEATNPRMLARQESVAEVPDLPDEDVPIEELLEHRKEAFRRKMAAAAARRLVPVNVKIDGPVGITWFGDPHIDDDGCNLPQLEADVQAVSSTKGMLAGNIGDTNNNWIGRLARLWEHQSTTGKQAWLLVEWFVKSLPWLVFLGGNHGAWAGSGDPLQWMLRNAPTLQDDMEARFELRFPNGTSSL